MTQGTDPSTDVATRKSAEIRLDDNNIARLVVDPATLRSIDSFEDALALLADTLGAEDIGDASDLGDGFTLLDSDDKDRLIGIPLVFLTWAFSQGDFGPFVTTRVLAQIGSDTHKLILNDGSTGIYQQLREYTDRMKVQTGLVAKRGLRKSTYANEFTDKGVTYYIDTSK